MFTSMPQTTAALMNWSWGDIEPYYKDLAARQLTSRNVSEWLADWTSLDERVSEMYSRLHVATTCDTSDRLAEERYNAFLDQIYPAAEAAEQALRKKLLGSGLEPEGFEVPLRKMRAQADLYREANLPLLSEEQKLASAYDKIIGAQTVTWEGKETTISQLRPAYQSTDRSVRERAWRLAAERQLADRPAIDELWQQLLQLRLKLAANADKRTYRDYRWQEMERFDYTAEDCKQFHQAIEEAVVPAAKRVYEKHRRQLGVETLRPWDLEVDPLGRPPLRPYQEVEKLKSIGASILHRVDSQLGDYFDIMVQEGLLDLDNRKNKAPGGYCTSFPMSKRPFIFANSVGLHDDLQTLLHESGHAFHAFERNSLPFSPQRQVGMEFSEVASMGMELLAAPYLAAEQGGVYSRRDAARARVETLEKNIAFWPYMAVVDSFQHWVYENPERACDPEACDTEWGFQWQRFMGGIDWSGLGKEMRTGWHRKLHIHRYPFYYVEYGLAQLGATQIWANALRNQQKAVAEYRRALALGGTVSLPELYSAAGAKFAFDGQTLRDAVGLTEGTINTLEHDA